jgi:nucleoside-diphosphate-sugar epimerase
VLRDVGAVRGAAQRRLAVVAQAIGACRRSGTRYDNALMRTPVTLVTGAGGEIGHGLIGRLAELGRAIITIDIAPLETPVRGLVAREFTGSITDAGLLERVLAQFEVDLVFHLAALLSTRAEFTPAAAHHVNVDGTLNLLEFAQREGESHGRTVVFVYPSSIAAYGLPDLETKRRTRPVREEEWNVPQTMYGCNKLYCEHLGRYYSRHYKQLAAEGAARVDFRSVRFPGLMSAETLPSGGTSDFAPEMLHAAARGHRYACFVRPDTRIPLMAMPDAVAALVQLAAAPRARLTRPVYNVAAFSPTAQQIHDIVTGAFPDAALAWQIDAKRQRILDSWPAELDDAPARQDWGFLPRYDLAHAFDDYLIPRIRERYRSAATSGPVGGAGGHG